jgi:tetratricopeptide (TPR) repeat protein
MKNSTKLDTVDKATNIDAFDAQELFALARLDLERGSLEQALQKIKRLIAEPEVPNEAFALAARLYAQLGLWNKAKDLFQKYVKLNPQAVTENFQLGMVCFDAGQIDEALKIWTDLLQKQPTHPPALFYRALALTQSGKTVEARQNLDILLKSIPTDNLYFGRGKELLQAIETQQPPGSVRTLQQKDVLPGIAKDAYKTEH